jgi:hypothetical protein
VYCDGRLAIKCQQARALALKEEWSYIFLLLLADGSQKPCVFTEYRRIVAHEACSLVSPLKDFLLPLAPEQEPDLTI